MVSALSPATKSRSHAKSVVVRACAQRALTAKVWNWLTIRGMKFVRCVRSLSLLDLCAVSVLLLLGPPAATVHASCQAWLAAGA